jgi:hypothetical protein
MAVTGAHGAWCERRSFTSAATAPGRGSTRIRHGKRTKPSSEARRTSRNAASYTDSRWPTLAARRRPSPRGSKDAYDGPYLQLQLVRIYLLVGEPEKALDRLEPLLRVPFYLSPAWLKIDPTFDSVRENPRFRRLVEGTA